MLGEGSERRKLCSFAIIVIIEPEVFQRQKYNHDYLAWKETVFISIVKEQQIIGYRETSL